MTETVDIARIRDDFPILKREIQPGVPLVYLDNAATSQKPASVLAALDRYYTHSNANVHRGIHTLAEEATAGYELARDKIAAFINANSRREVIYTRNATEAINLVAQSWGRANITAGDRIVITEMEHHSNLVPWQMLAAETGAVLDPVPVTDDYLLDMNALDAALDRNPRLVAIVHMSNTLGTINPIAEIASKAHAAGALILVDGAQSVPHMPVDVQALGIDFLAFSGHKMLGPTGMGILWGRESLLDAMPPWMGGGDMINAVYLTSYKPNHLPHKFEAGTPNIAHAIGLGAAVDYLSAIGMDRVFAHELELTEYLVERLEEVPGLRHFGPALEHKGGAAAFTLPEVHAHDVAQIVDTYGVAIRAGHHCTMPLHDKFGVSATARASVYLYNTREEIDTLIRALYAVRELFA